MEDQKVISGIERELNIEAALIGESPVPLENARILIVDDNALSRLKLSKAVLNLGYQPETAEDGFKGLERLRAGDIDLVLLDIMMPEMDGYEVLKRMRDDQELREVPTLVISGLDEIEEIARAIELGAIDFLPKTFNTILLKARVNACLERVNQRARELELLRQIEQLTTAADALDSDDLNPMELDVRDIAEQPGPIGNLSRVLLNKSTMVYNRRESQAQQIKNLLGLLMLLVMGISFGLKPALAKLYFADIGNPLSVTLYTMGFTTLLMIAYAVFKKVKWTRLSLKEYGFCIVLALFTLIPQALLFWVATEVPAVVISILISLEAFMVFFVATIIGMERVNYRRFFGLFLGVLGVLVLLLPQFDFARSDISVIWMLLTMCIPAFFAGESILLALSKSFNLDLILASVLVFGTATIILLIFVGAFGTFVPISLRPGGFELAVFVFSSADTIATITFFKLIRYAGPVFTSQKAYTVAIGGVVWSVLLLQEAISTTSAVALALILAGLFFVAKKSTQEKLLRPHQVSE